MITALALGQMDEREDPEVVQRAEETAILKAQAATGQAELDRISELARNASSIREELAAALEKLKLLQTQLEKEQKQDSQERTLVREIQAEIKRLKERISELETELKVLLEKVRRLKEELAKRTTPPAPAEVQIRPSGSGKNLVPAFVECAASGIVIYDGANPKQVRLADLAKSPDFKALLERVKKNPKGTLIFLMRSDGISTYHRASAIARKNYCRNGKLPVLGQGKLDLSIFRRRL
jgi:seryl-tRNA synthetase